MSELPRFYFTDSPTHPHVLAWVRPPLDEPVLTVELYEKWYRFWLVLPDATVQALPTVLEIQAMDSLDFNTKIDHVWHPALMDRIAEQQGYVVDLLARELVTGRWVESGHTVLGDDLAAPLYDGEPEVHELTVGEQILTYLKSRVIGHHMGVLWHHTVNEPPIEVPISTWVVFVLREDVQRAWHTQNGNLTVTPYTVETRLGWRKWM